MRKTSEGFLNTPMPYPSAVAEIRNNNGTSLFRERGQGAKKKVLIPNARHQRVRGNRNDKQVLGR